MSQRVLFPCVVKDEDGLSDGSDPARAQRDVFQGSPALLQFGGGPFSQRVVNAQ